MSDNKTGLYGKFNISKADGSPIDPEADYFVLRLDGDTPYAEASRQAALEFAAAIAKINPTLYQQLIANATYHENMAVWTRNIANAS